MNKCSISDCSELARSRGWCEKHYIRWRRHGDPLIVKATSGQYLRGRSIEERFWRMVRKDRDCWVWQGNITAQPGEGYGRFWTGQSDVVAHRFSFELAGRTIPVGMQIDHLCRNRLCVNPDHMEAVSPKENKLRGEGVGAKNARKTHCPYGHPLDGVTTVHRGKAKGEITKVVQMRYCKTCARLKQMARTLR